MWRGKTVMFVGDSLALNQYESLLCMLHAAAAPGARTTVSPASGKIDPSYTVRFEVRSHTVVQTTHAHRSPRDPIPSVSGSLLYFTLHGPRRHAMQSLLDPAGGLVGEKKRLGWGLPPAVRRLL
jgi:hypothetical protein